MIKTVTVTKTETRTVRVCDKCEREMGMTQSCVVCGRELCTACCQLIFIRPETWRFVESAMKVCVDCRRDGAEFLDRMNHAVATADAALIDQLDAWKQVVKRGEVSE